jgi:hypothetical protein
MDLREVCLIRTRLRQVNVEFSALLRAGSSEGRFVRMSELKAERKALMALMAQALVSGSRRHPVPRQHPSVGVALQATEGTAG